MLQQLAPNARIGVGHGQMGEAELEKTMLQFMRHEFDILVCTTIIENGLDIPLANTMLVENAERYGLSELYQLRGRVGRSNRRAYAYLLVPPDTELTRNRPQTPGRAQGIQRPRRRIQDRRARPRTARRRQPARRRAARPHQLRRLRHLRPPARRDRPRTQGRRDRARDPFRAQSRASTSASPPTTSPTKTSACAPTVRSPTPPTPRPAIAAEKELADRYGAVPEAVRNLLEYSALKTLAEQIGVEAIDRRAAVLSIKFHNETRVDPPGS